MKYVHKLRKAVAEKSRALELLKNKFVKLLLENDKVKELTSDVARLKDLLRTRDAKITTLENEVALLKVRVDLLKGEVLTTIASKSFKIPFIKETAHALFCAEHAVVDASTNFLDCKLGEAWTEKLFNVSHPFASRFMPNVKFKTRYEDTMLGSPFLNLLTELKDGKVQGNKLLYFAVNSSGTDLVPAVESNYNRFGGKEISIYEAIPELVPDGMVYDEDSDSLMPSKTKEDYLD